MGKDPAFLFYPGDWDGGTKLFTRAEKGAYMDLLICQFHSGHMSAHEVGHILGQADYESMWESKLKHKFIQDSEGRFFNERIEIEQLRRKNWCESRRNNKEGKNQYSGHMTKHMIGHMENENKDENDNDNIKNNQIINFDIIWKRYPRPIGKKQAFKHFCASVKTKKECIAINQALDNYLSNIESQKIEEQFIKHGSTWFNNWKDYQYMENKERWNKL